VVDDGGEVGGAIELHLGQTHTVGLHHPGHPYTDTVQGYHLLVRENAWKNLP
jgi:hypothetical protein